jgi:catechol 2,3-dioxygenase-like lactoylglutathione lyase family enzyme
MQSDVVATTGIGADMMSANPDQGAQMSRSGTAVAGGIGVLGTLLLSISAASAQASWATLEAPPSGIAAPGDVLRAGHLGREIGETQNIIHFYTDLIGLGLIGPRDAPRPFMASHPLAEFAELGEDDNAYNSVSRVALLPIPGTSATPGGTAMTIEAIEIKGIKSRPYNPPMTDPGATYLKLIVADLDKTLGLLKAERVPIITVGGNPLELSGWPGIEGKIRAVFVRDPDGYPVELMQVAPQPTSTAPPGSKVLGARVTVVVDNLEATCRLYQSLVGPDFKFWLSPTPMGDKAYEALTHTSGQFRMAMALVPGSPVVMEFIEYVHHNKHFKRGFIQDPGTAHFLFMSKDDDIIMPRVLAAKVHTLSKSNAPVFIGPTTRSFFVPDPQGFWLEFMDHDVKKDPAAK